MALTPEELEQLAEMSMDSDYKEAATTTSLPPQTETLTETEGRPYKQMPALTGEENALLAQAAQSYQNMGYAGVRALGPAFAKLASMLGVEGAERYLRDLEATQNMDIAQTARITRDKPVQEFIGAAGGETLALPMGGGAGGTLVSAFKAFITNAVAGGVSSAGDPKNELSDIAADAAMSGGIGSALDVAGTQGKNYLMNRVQKQVATPRGGSITPPDPESIAMQQQMARQIEPGVNKTGIQLLPAQTTLNPYQLEAQSFLANLPEGSSTAFQVLRQQNEQASVAVQDLLLNALGDPLQAGRSGARTAKTADEIVGRAEWQRTQLTHPMFENAFSIADGLENPIIIDLNDVRALIDPMLDSAPDGGKIQATIGKVARMLKLSEASPREPANRFIRPRDAVTATPEPLSLRELQNIKIEIDEMLSAQGDSAVGKTLGRHLNEIRTTLIQTMEAQSPDYKAAMDMFRGLSPYVDSLVDGKIGQLADLDPAQYKNASKILFDSAETNPETMIEAIRVFKGVEGGREMISNLLRSEVERRMGRMRVDIMDPTRAMGLNVENVPSQLKTAIFGNVAQRKVLMSALQELDKDVAKNALWLEETLDRASRGRPGGSQTAIRQEIQKSIDKPIGTTLRNIFRRPMETTGAMGEEAMISARRDAFVDALFDPDYADEMRDIRRTKILPKALAKVDALTAKVLDVNMAIRNSDLRKARVASRAMDMGIMTRAGTAGIMHESEEADFYYDDKRGQIRANN